MSSLPASWNSWASALTGAVEVVGAVSSSVSAQWTHRSSPGSHPNPSDRDEVVWIGFDSDEGAASKPKFLNVCFSNGFQIWEVLDAADDSSEATRQTQPLREIVSVRQGYTKLAQFLQTVPVAEDSVLYGAQPAVALVGGDEDGDINLVRVYSLREADYVHKLRFHGEVHAVSCGPRWMVVALKNQLLLHSLDSFDVIRSFTTYPSPTPAGVLALSSHTFAYPSNQPLRSDAGAHTAPSNTYGSAFIDTSIGVAGTAANAALQIGGMGLRALDAYLSSSPPLAQLPEQSSEYAGCVVVRSAATLEVVHHFRAHDGPVSLMRFDGSGSLLVTAAVDGHNLNLFRLERATRTPRHLYKLVRGVTSTIIQDVSFREDNKWIAVTSGRGTSHIFAINPDGAPASVETHVPGSEGGFGATHTPDDPSSESASLRMPCTAFAVQRIKSNSQSAALHPLLGTCGQCCARFAGGGGACRWCRGRGC